MTATYVGGIRSDVIHKHGSLTKFSMRLLTALGGLNARPKIYDRGVAMVPICVGRSVLLFVEAEPDAFYLASFGGDTRLQIIEREMLEDK